MGGSKRRRTGLTLIEMLVVIALIGVLVGLAFPAVQNARQVARRKQCGNNLMQIGIALHNYDATHEVLPPGVVDYSGPIRNRPVGYHVSWAVQILPYLEQKNVYNHFNFLSGAYAPENVSVRLISLDVFQCPNESRVRGIAQSSYAGCHHDDEAAINSDNKGVFFLNSKIRYDDVTDGTSHTIYVGEKRNGADLGWASGTRATLRNTGTVINGVTRPAPGDLDPVGGYGSKHNGGVNFLLGDGSVRFLAARTALDPRIYRLLGNRMDGEMIVRDKW